MSLFFDQGATAGLIDCPLSDSAMPGRDRSPLRSADSNGVPFLPLVSANLEADDVLPSRFFRLGTRFSTAVFRW
jgi:hypothetical protein